MKPGRQNSTRSLPIRQVIGLAQRLQVPPTLTLRNGQTITGQIVASAAAGVQLTPYMKPDVMIPWTQIAKWSLPQVNGDCS